MPADAQAAANVKVDVTPSPMVNSLRNRLFLKLRFTKRAYTSAIRSDRLHKLCKLTAATRKQKAVADGKSEVVAITQREMTAKASWERRRKRLPAVPGMP